jgi:histone-lysine N-methyltransferase SETD3
VDPSFSRFSLDRFSWARMIVCSRNFGLTVDGVKTAALVPFADMLNHYRPRETRCGSTAPVLVVVDSQTD